VHVIGHPNGLPLKVAGNARVTKNDGAECFESDEESTRVTLFSRLLGPGWQELDDNPATVAIAAGTPLGPTGLTVPSL
jgi:hypothetical protein